MKEGITPIPGFPHYGVTREGRIFSQKSRAGAWRELRGHPKGKGGDYLKIKLYENGTCTQIAIHSLVARTFHGLKPEEREGSRIEVNHKDFNKRNNHESNLEWVTQKENVAHAVAGGRWPTMSEEERILSEERARARRRIFRSAPSRLANRKPKPRGTQMANHKVSEYEVRTMRTLWPSHSFAVIARMYGLSKQHVHRIIRGVKWAHVDADGAAKVDP
jgi:hypothetical protein